MFSICQMLSPNFLFFTESSNYRLPSANLFFFLAPASMVGIPMLFEKCCDVQIRRAGKLKELMQ